MKFRITELKYVLHSIRYYINIKIMYSSVMCVMCREEEEEEKEGLSGVHAGGEKNLISV